MLAAGAGIGQEAATRPRVTASPTVTPTPSPSLAATPAPSPARIQTLDELQSRIRQRLFAPEVRRGRIGVKIVSLNSGRVIFENDSEKYFMPASNMKNFTVAAGLERLGPDFRIITSVFSNAAPDTSGTVRGDLRVFGRGDISISTAFFGTSAADPETYFKGIDRLADKIIAAGVRRVEGSIVGDESYFKGFAIPPTWEWDDLQWYYGAEISALPLNDNAVDIGVRPGTGSGPCAVTISPANTLMQIVNLCTTSPVGTKRSLQVEKKLDRNYLQIKGTMPADDPGFRGSVAFTRPGDLFVSLLKTRLESKGVIISGGARTMPANISATGPQVEIARLESAPFSMIAAKTMKPSQNMYTETILWMLGEQARDRLGAGTRQSATSADLGIDVVKEFLGSIGIPEDGIRQYDGSGLSRHNLITPAAVVALYTYMGKQSRHAQAWRDSLTIGGVDGTLANRFKGTAAAGNMRGKTGTIDQVSALSGYVTTAAGEDLVLSILVNGVTEPRMRTSLIDDIVIGLAHFNGKVD